MKFRLVENVNDKYWYHFSPYIFRNFEFNWQGIHFADSLKAAKYFLENRKIKTANLYIVSLQNLKPLYIDLDPMSWGAVDIARLFIAKINNETIEGSAGENISDIEGNYRYDLSPDLVHINNLTKDDLDFLYSIKENSKDQFKKIAEFIESKGFNSILYPLAEDITNKSKAIIIWDDKLIKNTMYKPNMEI